MLLLGVGPFFGSFPANAGNRVALVMGNSAYVHAPALVNPVNDATDIAEALRDIGFEVIERRNADQRAMIEAIREFSHLLPGAEIALFYYAGHAFQVAGNNYLLPTDVKIEGRYRRAAAHARSFRRNGGDGNRAAGEPDFP